MLICSCNTIRKTEIDRAVDELLAADPFLVLTPGTVFRRLGRRPRCAGCFPLVVTLVHEQCDRLREAAETAQARQTGVGGE